MAIKWNLTRVRVIELVSITAGLATLISAGQNIMSRLPRPFDGKMNHQISRKLPPSQENVRGFNVHHILVAELVGQPAVTDSQFSALISVETSFMKDLPPLVEKLHKDLRLLQQLQSDQKTSKNHELLAQAKQTVVNDKEKIMRRMLEDRERMGEIVPIEQQLRINQVTSSG
jgi:hypothetical protein